MGGEKLTKISKIAVFGATGLTGGLVVEQALARGHEVAALVRDPRRLTMKHPRLEVIGGSPIAASDAARCVRGADAVIHCLGIGGKGDGRPTTLVSESVCMSNVGAGGSGTWLANRVVIPLLLRWLVPIIEDKDRMESALRASPVEWISVRLPSIVEGPAKPVRVSADGRGIGLSISAASAAGFLLEQASSSAYVHQAPSISH
jgi:uncharacterized protein YbjT (DUF2867 family)